MPLTGHMCAKWRGSAPSRQPLHLGRDVRLALRGQVSDVVHTPSGREVRHTARRRRWPRFALAGNRPHNDEEMRKMSQFLGNLIRRAGRGIGRIVRRAAPILRNIARIAAPIVSR
jgi:hypothetical protein